MSTVEVAVRVDAPPDRVWSLVSDPTAMAGITEECTGTRWSAGSSGPEVGATFKGRNRSGFRRWTTTCTIVRYERGSEIAWDVAFGPLAVARWAYRVEPDEDGGTTISERFEDHRSSGLRLLAPLVRGTNDTAGLNRANMATTLSRIKSLAES
jgi:uncharacterized protein YndB with AHSA1/START domain